MKAMWKNTVIAQSQSTVELEGNHYFPAVSVDQQYLRESQTQSTCPWKGRASYYHILVDGETNTDAAWYYPEPKAEAAQITDHIAFWRGVQIISD
ncbi:MAG: DUF427 domain-containing protein [Gammaproteobacteria bacterium]|nr:DUF427 domain-containing protein [Gammaproteobacteria bacterium]MDH5799759.1 DUF427 domain-containing protein [Gammaproteobacteria bacterium]